ncbi:MAG: hypothetical protein MUC87_18140 [Bacteroidia bacterium]|jgi:hypothetical protein|nr:hypothetical protein [Bacteroidia bacterium]
MEHTKTQPTVTFTKIDDSNAKVTVIRDGQEYSVELLVFTEEEVAIMRELEYDREPLKKQKTLI